MAENRAILNGEEPSQESVNRVGDVPQNFKKWLTENDGRMDKAKSMPYFLKDNPKYSGVQRRYGAVGVFTGTKLGRSATKAAFKAYENIPAPTLTDEVVNNTNEIARDLGIQGPVKPMTFLEANEGRANTNFGQGEEFNSNCQVAVAVHEARLRGLNVTSVGYDASEGSVSYILGEHFEQIWRHPNKEKTPAPTILRDQSFDAMVGKVEKATKATGRYHIGINMSDNRGHVITAERFADGRIIYYDAQSGVFLNIEEYAVSGVEYFEVLKVDKLLLRPDLFRQIARLL